MRVQETGWALKSTIVRALFLMLEVSLTKEPVTLSRPYRTDAHMNGLTNIYCTCSRAQV
jgi:hypothetical protein